MLNKIALPKYSIPTYSSPAFQIPGGGGGGGGGGPIVPAPYTLQNFGIFPLNSIRQRII